MRNSRNAFANPVVTLAVTHLSIMKTDLSFKVLAAAIIAGVITALFTPAQAVENSQATRTETIAITKN